MIRSCIFDYQPPSRKSRSFVLGGIADDIAVCAQNLRDHYDLNVECVNKSYFTGIDVAAVCVDVRVVGEEYRLGDTCGGGNRTARIT